jgi:arginine-tRNA-protein transferase
VARFRPSRSQRRNRKQNAERIQLTIGSPLVSAEKLALYDRFHRFQAESKDWPPPDDDINSYRAAFVDHPVPTEEWLYKENGELVGVGYVDNLPIGLSAIYFYHDPARRRLGLGTWNVLSLISEAVARRLPHVYLGYYVAGCRSLAYKAGFAPNQIRAPDGSWRDLRLRRE